MRIAFTHNVRLSDDESQAEFDSIETIDAISAMLRDLGHEVHPVDVSGPTSRLVARLELLAPDLVFNTAEGSHGRYREAFYPALFDQLGLAFTGSGAQACALTLDKRASKAAARSAGVPTPGWAFVDARSPLPPDHGLRFPVIAKPNFEGSSKGISAASIVRDEPALRALLDDLLSRYPEGALVEEFIPGRDVTVPYIEALGALEPASYRFEGDHDHPDAIYDYTLKNDLSDLVHVDVPARAPDAVRAQLRAYTEALVREMDIHDLARVDFRLGEDGSIHFIELNALPSLEPGASLYVSAMHGGLAHERDVLGLALQTACSRHGVTPREDAHPDALDVALVYNLRRVDPRAGSDAEAEFDSQRTVDAIADAIASLGHRVSRHEATAELPRVLSSIDVDLAFNISEGIRGRSREAQVPALLDLLGIEYTGSDAAAMSVTLDKQLAKRLVREAGVPTPRGWLVPPGGAPPEGPTFPVIVKPNAEGSSKGVSATSVAADRDQMLAQIAAVHARYGSPALVEEFLSGREFTVGMLGERDPRVLPIMEIVFTPGAGAHPVYSFEHKTEADSTVSFEVPADLDDALAAAISAVALGAFDALGCRDVARVDVRLDAAGVPHFIECNPLPGLSPGFSDLCVIAERAGLDHAALVGAILAPAVGRLRRAREAGR
jgi:D-alanine-D-alanine ligase